MQNLGTWFSGGIDSVRLMAGLDLDSLLQAEQFYDSIITPGAWTSIRALQACFNIIPNPSSSCIQKQRWPAV